MKNYHSINQIAAAKEFIQVYNELLSYDNDVILEFADELKAAYAVLKWESDFWKLVLMYKKSLNDMALSLKGVWQTLRGFPQKSVLELINSFTIDNERISREAIETFNRIRPRFANFPTGCYECSNETYETTKVKQTTRAGKRNKQIKDARKTDVLHSLYSDGKPNIKGYGHISETYDNSYIKR